MKELFCFYLPLQNETQRDTICVSLSVSKGMKDEIRKNDKGSRPVAPTA